jgi:hypothetical protein
MGTPGRARHSGLVPPDHLGLQELGPEMREGSEPSRIFLHPSIAT